MPQKTLLQTRMTRKQTPQPQRRKTAHLAVRQSRYPPVARRNNIRRENHSHPTLPPLPSHPSRAHPRFPRAAARRPRRTAFSRIRRRGNFHRAGGQINQRRIAAHFGRQPLTRRQAHPPAVQLNFRNLLARQRPANRRMTRQTTPAGLRVAATVRRRRHSRPQARATAADKPKSPPTTGETKPETQASNRISGIIAFFAAQKRLPRENKSKLPPRRFWRNRGGVGKFPR